MISWYCHLELKLYLKIKNNYCCFLIPRKHQEKSIKQMNWSEWDSPVKLPTGSFLGLSPLCLFMIALVEMDLPCFFKVTSFYNDGIISIIYISPDLLRIGVHCQFYFQNMVIIESNSTLLDFHNFGMMLPVSF